MRKIARLSALWLVGVMGVVADSRGQDQPSPDHGKVVAKKHYLTFQVSYFGTAERTHNDADGQTQTTIDVNDRFSGRIEVRPTEAYDLPTGASAEAQVQQAAAIQAAVLAGDTEKLQAVTPPLLVTWFPQGDEVDLTGTISETKTLSATGVAHGESRATSDLGTDSYRSQKMFGGSFVNAFVKIHAEEKTYDIQFTLMPDMASTGEAVHQTLVWDHREEGHDSHSETEAKVPLDMGPGQMVLGYSNYQIVAEAKGLPLAGEANELIGHTRIPVPKPAGWDGAWDIGLLVSWQIDVTLPPVELIITAAGYDEWRPEGNIKKPKEPGNSLTARATLQPKAGTGTFVPKVKSIRLQLLDTSREPGVCLNWPLAAKDDDYDLRLEAVAGGKLSKSDQILEVTDPKRNDAGQPYAEVKINSYDFGGRASLRAICLLNDGREIEGVMKDVGEAPMLPKMKHPGWVADTWKKAHQVEKLADDDDNEEIKGQKDNGDGFTLYEEYRGWVEKGKHIEGDPKGKDFFVLNLIGGDAEAGIDLFEQLSKLRVYSRLRDATEMSQEDRLMNGNHRDAPHHVDQHGVWVKTFGSKSELGDEGAMTTLLEKGVAGRPGITKGIGILARNNTESAFNKPFNLATQDVSGTFDRAIAHELLHSVGVEHHGRGDRVLTLAYNPPGSRNNHLGRPYYSHGMLGQDPVRLLDEGGADVAAKDLELYTHLVQYYRTMLGAQLLEGARKLVVAGRNNAAYMDTPEKKVEADLEDLASGAMPMSGIVGVERGEHSGQEDCVMRYYFAKFYEGNKAGEKTFYLVTPGTEHIGVEICHDGKGTGVNDAGHKPQSRYGDAATDAGNCFEQICPNDAIPPRSIK